MTLSAKHFKTQIHNTAIKVYRFGLLLRKVYYSLHLTSANGKSITEIIDKRIQYFDF